MNCSNNSDEKIVKTSISFYLKCEITENKKKHYINVNFIDLKNINLTKIEQVQIDLPNIYVTFITFFKRIYPNVFRAKRNKRLSF